MKLDHVRLAGALKEKRGKTPLQDLAKEVGVNESTLSKLERAFPIAISAESYGALCKWLGVSTDTFYMSKVAA